MDEPISFLALAGVLLTLVFMVDWVGDHVEASERGASAAEAAAGELWGRVRTVRADPAAASGWTLSAQDALEDAADTVQLATFGRCDPTAGSSTKASWLAGDGSEIAVDDWSVLANASDLTAVQVTATCELVTPSQFEVKAVQVTAVCWDSGSKIGCAAGRGGA